MPPVVVTVLGFFFMLALLVGVHLGVRSVARRAPLALSTTLGVLASYLTCAAFFLVAMVGVGRQEQTLRVKVDSSGPAYKAGLRDGDRLLAVNGWRPAGWDEVRAMIQDGATQAVDLEVERGAETLRFAVRPRGGVIGVASIVEHRELPLGQAVATAVAAPVFSIVSLARQLTGPRTMMGPVAIVERGSSPWPLLFRLGELGSYAWPFSMRIAFGLLRRRTAP